MNKFPSKAEKMVQEDIEVSKEEILDILPEYPKMAMLMAIRNNLFSDILVDIAEEIEKARELEDTIESLLDKKSSKYESLGLTVIEKDSLYMELAEAIGYEEGEAQESENNSDSPALP